MHPIMLIIKWLGQACFVLTTTTGMNIMFDPYHNTIGYDEVKGTSAQVVFVSHNHPDHNATELVEGKPVVIKPLPANEKINKSSVNLNDTKLSYTQIQSFHDTQKGKERGLNTINIVEADGMRICHLGDLGTTLTKEQIKEIGKVDVLMIPVGGVYTIDGKTAIKVVHQLNPRVAIPMHYKLPGLKIGLDTADEFVKGFKNVKYVDSGKLMIDKRSLDSLPKETTVFVWKISQDGE